MHHRRSAPPGALLRGLDVMPDVQYVIRPDGADVYPNALVAGMEFRVNF